MLNQQIKKVRNQHKAMRQRQRLREQLRRERYSLIHRVAEQTRVLHEHRTNKTDRDGVPSDLRSSIVMRHSRRLCALKGRLAFVSRKLERIHE